MVLTAGLLKKFLNFIKKEAVLCVSGLLALISCFIVNPSEAYAGYIDFRVLILLWCLMLVVAGIRKTGAFSALCALLLKKLNRMKAVGLFLVLLNFFMSMLLTNDVTLVTTVPFTLLLFEKISGENKTKALIFLLVFETAAANLGSMLTPMGNPQNLYLYTKFSLSFSEFFDIIFPFCLFSLILLTASTLLFMPKLQIKALDASSRLNSPFRLIFFIILFCVNVLTIMRAIDDKLLFLIVALSVLIIDRRLFLEADYSLLLTFIFFFVFVGNLGSVSELSKALKAVFEGNEVWLGIILSQIISNVPSAILLSEISDNASGLILGTDLGGLGTLIASMASLITYKFYVKTEKSSPGRYILIFTLFNLGYLTALYLQYLIIR